MWLGLDDVPFYKFQGDKKAQQYIFSDVMNVLDEWPSIFPCRIYKFWEGKQDIHAFDIEIKTWGFITNIQYSTNTVHIGFCDYGFSGQSGYSGRNPVDGPLSQQLGV